MSRPFWESGQPIPAASGNGGAKESFVAPEHGAAARLEVFVSS